MRTQVSTGLGSPQIPSLALHLLERTGSRLGCAGVRPIHGGSSYFPLQRPHQGGPAAGGAGRAPPAQVPPEPGLGADGTLLGPLLAFPYLDCCQGGEGGMWPVGTCPSNPPTRARGPLECHPARDPLSPPVKAHTAGRPPASLFFVSRCPLPTQGSVPASHGHMLPSPEPTHFHARSHLKNNVAHLGGRGRDSRHIMGSGTVSDVLLPGAQKGGVSWPPPLQRGRRSSEVLMGPRPWSQSKGGYRGVSLVRP